MTINVKRGRNNQWSSNLGILGWQFTLLRGEHTSPLASATTVRVRCGAGVNYAPWVSDDIVEYLVLSGSLHVNGVDLQEGDYACVEPGVDGFLSSKQGMECICIMRGNVLLASDVFKLIRDTSLTDDDAKKLLRLPWIDHLRRHASPSKVKTLSTAIKDSPSEFVRELCINIARNICSVELDVAVRRVFEAPRSLAMRISALLFLASKGDIGADEWAEQLKLLDANRDEFIDVVRSFYAINDLSSLRRVIEQRIGSGKYEYNYPLYKHLLTILERKA